MNIENSNFINKNGYNPLFNLKLKFPMSYDEFNSTRTKELEIYAETESEALLWTCEGLRNAFKNGKKTVSIRYSSKKLGIYWTATIILSEDEPSHHLHAVYICKDVSELVKVEQERKNKLEKEKVIMTHKMLNYA